MADPELTENQEALTNISRGAEQDRRDFETAKINEANGVEGASEEAAKKKLAMMAAFEKLGRDAVAQFQKTPEIHLPIGTASPRESRNNSNPPVETKIPSLPQPARKAA